MRKADIITGGVLLVFAAYVLVTSLGLELWTTGADSAPGPGFVSFVAGLVLALLAACLIVRALQSKEADGKAVFTKEGFKMLAVIAGSALVASLISSVVGFIISMGLMGGFLTTVLAEKRSLKTTILATVLLPAALYLIFKVGLSVILPVGILGV